MCRLFGLHAGTLRVRATFWLLNAPDSLAAQSRREPDGTGLGVFTSLGSPIVSRQPMAAWEDRAFAQAAHDFTSTTFLAHVRYATTGSRTVENTHPFEQDGRLFAHNGVCRRLELLDERLAAMGAAGLVRGQTDSERIFALVTAETRRNGGNVSTGLMEALTWITDNLPLYSLNLIITSPTDLWALRYPDTDGLYVLRRPAGGTMLQGHFDGRSSRISARSHDLAQSPAVVVASEPMDNEPGWRPLKPGELLHVGPDLDVRSSYGLPKHPRYQMEAPDRGAAGAAAQDPEPE